MEHQDHIHEETMRSPAPARDHNVAKITVEQLGLSLGARTAAQSAGLTLATDLAAKSEVELKILGFRPRDIRVVADRLSMHGLSVSMTHRHSADPEKSEEETPMLLLRAATRMSKQSASSESDHGAQDAESYSGDMSTADIFSLPPKKQQSVKERLTDDNRALRKSERAPAEIPIANIALIDRLRSQPTMGVEDAAALYGCSRNTAYRDCKLGKIPTVRKGRSIRVITALVFAELHLPL